MRVRFMLAILIECVWEVLENSPLVIDRYRTVTSAFDYMGDSILNSFFDIVAAGFGFYLANKLRVRTIVVAIIAMELFTGFMVRDNLTFNIIMLIYPIDAIKEWQLKADFVPEELRIK